MMVTTAPSNSIRARSDREATGDRDLRSARAPMTLPFPRMPDDGPTAEAHVAGAID